MMSNRNTFTVAILLLSVPASGLAQGQFLRSMHDLGDPRGFCLDIPGFGPRIQIDAPISAHSCKYSLPGFDVDEILELSDEKLRLVNFDRCLSPNSIQAGSDINSVDCSTAQNWRFHTDGRVTPTTATDHCLTLSAGRAYVNSSIGTLPPYSSRRVNLELCSNEASYRQRWRWSAPDEQTTYNANSLRNEIPREIQARNREIGTVIDPQATAEIYRDAQRSFGPADVVVSGELSYGPNERHLLQIYGGNDRNPPGGFGPVIVLVHGGGFAGGSLESLAHVARHFAGLGFVAVNVTYPLAPEYTWPSGAESVSHAVEWVRANIDDYRGDPERIYLMGHSAGGNHVANYVFRPSLSSASGLSVAGVIVASPALELDPLGPAEPYAAYFQNDLNSWAEIRLLENIETASVPTLITVAEFDPKPFYQATARLYARLVDDFGASPRFRQIPGHGHISYITAVGTSDRVFIEEALDFILADQGN